MSTDSTNGTSDNDNNHNQSININNHRINDTMMKPEVTAALEYAHLIGQLKLTPRTGWVRKGVPRYESVADHSWRVASLALLLMQPQQQEQQQQQQQQQQHSQTKQQGQTKNHSEEISNSFGSLSSSSSSLSSYSSLDVQRCIAIAVVHDMAESIIGDITPDDHIPDHDKKHMEEVAMQKIASILHHATTSPNRTTTKTGSSTTTTTGIASSASSASTIPTPTTTSDYADTWLMQLFHEYEYKTTPEGQVVKDLDKLDLILQADEYEQSYTDVDLTEFFTSTPSCSFSHPFIQRIAKAIHERRHDRIVQQQQQQQSSVHDLSLPQSNDKQSRLSDRDQAFISEYAKASTLSSDAIDEVIRALRAWENR